MSDPDDDDPLPGFRPCTYQGAIDWHEAEVRRFTMDIIDWMISEGANARQVKEAMEALKPYIAKVRERGLREIDAGFARLQRSGLH